MIDEMTIRKCAPNTQHDYLQLVRQSQRSSDGLRLRQPSKRCAAISFIWDRALSASRSTRVSRPYDSSSRSPYSVTISSNHPLHPRVAQAAGDVMHDVKAVEAADTLDGPAVGAKMRESPVDDRFTRASGGLVFGLRAAAAPLLHAQHHRQACAALG